MITLPRLFALALTAFSALGCILSQASACEVGCAPADVVYLSAPIIAAEASSAPSWVFRRSTFTNDPMTGARVAQYMRKAPVEPLGDQREVTSVYRRTRTVNRGFDGSMDTSYQVQAWGNGRGGIDAEWQMFNDVWKEAILSGSYYNSNQNFGPPQGGPWQGGPWQGGGWQNGPWQGGPWQGGGNWQGGPWQGGGNWQGGPWQGGPGNGPGWNQGHPPNNWNQGQSHNGGNSFPQMHWPHDDQHADAD